MQALLPLDSPWLFFFLFALMVLVHILWFLFMAFSFMTQIYVSNISHSGLSPQAHIYSSHCLLDIIKQTLTVTEHQHVQSQHIISPVSLQLATTTQTYCLFSQPLAKFCFYHLLTNLPRVHTLSQLPPPNPKTCLPIKCVFGLSLPLHAYLNQCYFLVDFCNTESHFSDLLDFIHISSQFIYSLFMFQGQFFRKTFCSVIISLDYSLYYFEHKG